ncbi:flavin-dependent oxidoreductase [Nonomuraea sp. NPDC050536]|uniref:flavin-dependent oxidoreductase n=1 Tax=Nonomuraea sp. NPDC050536 TaxID=3364366 RepID=UPI0037C547AC
MRILIVGGGIGGLAAALSLHAAGFTEITVTESVEEIRPLGVGINLLPHAVRELTELGLGEQLEETGRATAELTYFDRHGGLIWSEPRGLAAGYHWPQFSIHRGELQMLLLREVEARGVPVLTGRRLTRFDEAEAEFADGSTLGFDLLVGADGIRSTVRAWLYPDEGPPPWNGLVLWRGTTNAQPFLSGRSMIMAGDGERKFVAYPIKDGLINWIAERPVVGEAADRGDWNRRVPAQEILPHFEQWRFDWLDVPGLIAGAEAIYEYPMVDRDPLPRWTYGRVTLLGDAAHAMYPIGSNGASQAILDARALAFHLARSSDVGHALPAYEQDRREPTTALCLANRQMGPEIVMKLVHERAPDGFTDIEQVLPRAEREAIAASYKRLAGFHPDLLNQRPSYTP